MFHPMRRERQQMSQKDCEAVLERCTHGVLALIGDGGYPYAVPLSYGYRGGMLYFHGAKTGHKIDAIRACDKASFCVVDQDQVAPAEYTTRYRSVIAFGRVRILEDPQQVREALLLVGEKYNPAGGPPAHSAFIDKYRDQVCVFALQIEQLTGKESRALALERQRKES